MVAWSSTPRATRAWNGPVTSSRMKATFFFCVGAGQCAGVRVDDEVQFPHGALHFGPGRGGHRVFAAEYAGDRCH